ncbi:MAG: hypothetical protein M1819_002248 [Sarea resinae]|nr:MAG: hypothetical protein M1819_002248 [Sarea resinae]
MAFRARIKTTFEPERTLQPIYTGGSVVLDHSGRILATCLGEDAVLTDLNTGEQLASIEGDGEPITSIALTPSATHLIVCSRSLSMRIYTLKPSPASTSTLIAELARTLKPHSSPVVITAIDQTGTLLATGGADSVVKVWDIRGGFATHTFRGHSGVVSALHFFEVAAPAAEIHNGISAKNRRNSRRKSKGQEDESMLDVGGEITRGFRLASGAEDGKIRIWDLHKRTSLATLDSHVSIIRGLDFSPEENAVVSASRDKTAILWDARTWKVRRVIPILEGVEAVGFLDEGSLVYTGGENGRIRIWEAEGGREVTQEQDVGNEGEGIVDIIHQQDFLLSVHVDQTLILHDLSSVSGISSGTTLPPLSILRRISGTHDEIIDLAYVAPDSSLLALATNTEDIRIISLANAAESEAQDTSNSASNYFGADVALLKGHEEIIICIDTDWSGHWLATGAKDNTARLWRLDPEHSSFTCFATFTGHAESLGAIALPRTAPPADSPAFKSPLDHPPAFLLTGSQDKTIKRWDISSAATAGNIPKKAPRAIYTRKAHDKDINAIDIHHNSSFFASASQDRTVKIWSVEEGEVQGVLRGHRRGVWSVRFAPKGTPTITGDAGGPASGSRGFVLTGSGDKMVKIWSLTDYSCLRTLEGHTNSVLKVVWMNPPSSEGAGPDKRGVQVASAGGDGLVKVWDVSSGEVECTLDNHEDRVSLSPTATPPSAIPSTPSLYHPISKPSPPTQVWALAQNPATNGLISGSADSTLTIWTDTTSATAATLTATTSARLEQLQKLENHIHAHSYREAITLALQLNHPGRLLSLFKTVLDTNPPEEGSLMGLRAVDDVLATLAPEQLWTLLCRVRDWNTNVRTATVAQRVLWTVVKSYPANRLAELRGTGPGAGSVKGGGAGGAMSAKDLWEALRVYSERHYRRAEELVDESFLVEFVLREMDEVAFVDGSDEDGLESDGGVAGMITAPPAGAGAGAGSEEAMDGIVVGAV